jgi:hypothetical protein
MAEHRGYRITVERQFVNWEVHASPIYPWLPILSVEAFIWEGSEEDGLLEAMQRIDELLARVGP